MQKGTQVINTRTGKTGTYIEEKVIKGTINIRVEYECKGGRKLRVWAVQDNIKPVNGKHVELPTGNIDVAQSLVDDLETKQGACDHTAPDTLTHVRTDMVSGEIVVNCGTCGLEFEIMSFKTNTLILNAMTDRQTAFKTFVRWTSEAYRPTILPYDDENIILADAYDLIQQTTGSHQRIFRGQNKIPYPIPPKTEIRNCILSRTGYFLREYKKKNRDMVRVTLDNGSNASWKKDHCVCVHEGRFWPFPDPPRSQGTNNKFVKTSYPKKSRKQSAHMAV